MQKHHPNLVKEGKTPKVIPLLESKQSKVSSFFQPSKSTAEDSEPSSSSAITDQEEQVSEPATGEQVSEPTPSSSSAITDQDEQVSEPTTAEPPNIPIEVDIQQCESPAQDPGLEEEENTEKNISLEHDPSIDEYHKDSDKSSDDLNRSYTVVAVAY